MDDREANLFADFGIVGAHRLNVLLIEHDVLGPGGHIEDALLSSGHAVEEPEQQFPFLVWLRRLLMRRP